MSLLWPWILIENIGNYVNKLCTLDNGVFKCILTFFTWFDVWQSYVLSCWWHKYTHTHALYTLPRSSYIWNEFKMLELFIYIYTYNIQFYHQRSNTFCVCNHLYIYVTHIKGFWNIALMKNGRTLKWFKCVL